VKKLQRTSWLLIISNLSRRLEYICGDEQLLTLSPSKATKFANKLKKLPFIRVINHFSVSVKLHLVINKLNHFTKENDKQYRQLCKTSMAKIL